MVADSQFEPRMFEVSNAGLMSMKPIPAFSQQSLFEKDVYILDAWNIMFIWIGTESNDFEKKAAYRYAQKYIDALNDGRNHDSIQIVECEPTHESPFFKVQFPNWSNEYSKRWIIQQQEEESK